MCIRDSIKDNSSNYGWTKVIWDHSMTGGNSFDYRMGADNKYDLTLAKCFAGNKINTNSTSTFYLCKIQIENIMFYF